MAKKKANKRPNKYEEKISIKGSLEDVLKLSVTPSKDAKPAPRKDSKKK